MDDECGSEGNQDQGMIHQVEVIVDKDIPDLCREGSINFQNSRVLLVTNTICCYPEGKGRSSMIFSAEVLEVAKRTVLKQISGKMVIDLIIPCITV